jgi:hypothetical protein
LVRRWIIEVLAMLTGQSEASIEHHLANARK